MVLDLLVEKTVGKLAKIAVQEACKVLGVEKEIEKLRERMMIIRRFLEDAEWKRHTDETVNMWVKRLKDIMYDADDIIDDCMFEGGKRLEPQHPSSSSKRSGSSLFSSFPKRLRSSLFPWLSPVNHRHEIANRIEKLNDRLKEIADDIQLLPLQWVEGCNQGSQRGSGVTSQATSSGQHDPDIVGTQIEVAANDIIKSILEDDQKQKQGQVYVYGIVGMGGIGKTTLARKIYNDERVRQNFPTRIWLYISKNYSEEKLFKELIREARANVGIAESIQELENKFVSTLQSKNRKNRKILLVLDDLWSAGIWNDRLRTSILNSKVISKILITSRNANVRRTMIAANDHIYHVEKIAGDDGWELLKKKIAFKDEDEKMMPILKDVGTKILDKCDGLPLAIKVIAGTLLRKKTQREWEIILESNLWYKIDDEIPGALYLSYEDLPSHLKTCFLSCVLFKGSIDAFRLVRFWMAEGFIAEQPKVLMEESGEDYYKELVSRNLLQSNPKLEGERSFVMHDLLRALATKLTEGETMLTEDETPETNNLLTKIRRLSISSQRHTLTLPSTIIEQNCLRVLLVHNSAGMRIIEDNILKILRRLRVLDLSLTRIESIPNSIGELLYLKCLYLNKTNIHELPASVGDLMNLQTLSIQECRSLYRLPNSITRLCNLRCLCLEDAQLTHVPKGIGKLTNINHLDGFMVGCDDSANGVGCDLEELQCLSNLRFLRMEGLGRASSTGGATVLKDKSYLKCLFIDWNTSRYRCIHSDTTSDRAETIKRAESVCSQLSPPSPSHLEHLRIYNFPGRQLPDWIISKRMSTPLPCLTYIKIFNLPFCTVLPSLGQLPQLKYLVVERALRIKKIRPEFLKGYHFSSFPPFPKLDYLEFRDMPNWEEWELCAGLGDESGLRLFPNLTKCLLTRCSRLISLPKAFYRATNLKELSVQHCEKLERISGLPPLKLLEIENCSSLEHMENVDTPESLYFMHPRTNNEFLPQWLLDLLTNHNHQSGQHSLKDFVMTCDLPLLKSCLRGKPNWDIIQQIPKVYILCDGHWMQYTKNPFYYATDVTEDPE